MEELWVVCGFACRKWSYAIGSNMLTRYRGLGQFNTAIVVPSTSSRSCSRKRGQWKYRQFLSESRTVQKSNRIPRQLKSAKVGDKAGELWKSQQRLLQSIKPYCFLSQKSKRTKLWPDQCWITFSYYITSLYLYLYLYHTSKTKLAILVYHVTLIIFNGIHALSIGQKHAE